MKSAPRAEAPLNRSIWDEHEYSNLMQINQTHSTADGLWICSRCKAENNLVHVKGAYPFQYLICRSCEHVYCNDCISSEVLIPSPTPRIAHTHPDTRCGYICTACGLTHRAATSKTRGRCACGALPNPSWIPFSIGHPHNYRSDPNACAVNLKTAFMNRVYERRFASPVESCIQQPKAVFRPPRTLEPTYQRRQAPSAGSVRRVSPQTYATLSGPWNPDVY
ncbi:hypothetical protein T440DRAFT_464893 [Plenodomus tracheiphilus IPT5]|uniref:Probable double zinc ribbon domain-containing protein n=1 Tax=Plenodomus tracheiphilus IPT5 TaxID=1408161 RepID=A0A6A7BJW0_9PLEO|nr:hypothetical protein T440DRAFT_464893 [Plenodomus tracheiphilus IPT5]